MNAEYETEVRPVITSDLSHNLQELERLFGPSPDLVRHQFSTKAKQGAALVYLEGLVDKVTVNTHILHPLLHELKSKQTPMGVITAGQTKMISRFTDIETALFQGKSVLFLDGEIFQKRKFSIGWVFFYNLVHIFKPTILHG